MERFIFFALTIALLSFFFGRPRAFGSKAGQRERRHLEKDPAAEGAEELLQRRKDDNVGGEGG